jgi:hypothetical protein
MSVISCIDNDRFAGISCTATAERRGPVRNQDNDHHERVIALPRPERRQRRSY